MAKDWAEQQTHCPDGHDARWAAGGKTSWGSCNECPASADGLGHFKLWCNTCRRFRLPPNCQQQT